MKALPKRGRIGIFNRSYYEEVPVVRVHPELFNGQRLPPSLVTKHIWRDLTDAERALFVAAVAPVLNEQRRLFGQPLCSAHVS